MISPPPQHLLVWPAGVLPCPVRQSLRGPSERGLFLFQRLLDSKEGNEMDPALCVGRSVGLSVILGCVGGGEIDSGEQEGRAATGKEKKKAGPTTLTP